MKNKKINTLQTKDFISIGVFSLVYFAAAFIIGGVAQMMTKTPTMQGQGKEAEKQKSTSFTNLSNMAAQGRPVPLAYGKIRTGSLIISQGVETYDVETAKTSEKPAGFRKGRM